MKTQYTPGPWRIGDAGHTIFGPKKADGSLPERIADIKSRVNAPIIATAPELICAMANLLEWAKGNRGSKVVNPYCVPEVQQALKALALISGEEDWLGVDTASFAATNE